MNKRLRLGSALFNADHAHLAAEVRKVEEAGIDFLHVDIFDGHFVPDLAFPPRTMQALRPLTALPFEVHLAVNDPLRFLPTLARSGANLVFLPAESTPLLYEAIFAAREQHLQVGLCLALGTPLQVLEPVLPLLDAILLLGRVTGEGQRGRTLNDLLFPRLRHVRQMIEAGGYAIDLQAAGGLEMQHCRAAIDAGATSLPLGAALHREQDLSAYVALLRAQFLSVPALAASIDEQAHSPGQPQAQTPYRVLVASRSFGPNCPEAVERLRALNCELLPNEIGRAPTEEELLARVGEVDALISGTEPVTARVLAAAPRLKVIAKHGVGYENIDLDAARARDIPVVLAGGVIADSVADMALALLLALARQIPQGDRSVRAGQWRRLVGCELRQKVLGIVGLGQIGKAVCRRARGFGMEVVAFDLYPDEHFANNWGVTYLPLDEVLERADFVSLHTPVTPETFHLLDAARLARMKAGAYLINTARGELVDEAALAAALRSGHLAGAASDVFEKEPPGANPLLELDTFIATPHSAGQTWEGLRQMGEITADNVIRALTGQPLRFRVV